MQLRPCPETVVALVGDMPGLEGRGLGLGGSCAGSCACHDEILSCPFGSLPPSDRLRDQGRASCPTRARWRGSDIDARPRKVRKGSKRRLPWPERTGSPSRHAIPKSQQPVPLSATLEPNSYNNGVISTGLFPRRSSTVMVGRSLPARPSGPPCRTFSPTRASSTARLVISVVQPPP